MNKKELRTLKAKSKNWSPDKWEKYLQTLEHERSESLMSPKKYEKQKEKNPFLWEDFLPKDKPDDLKQVLKRALNKLTFKQKKVIEMIFFEGLSEGQVAKKLGRSTSTVKSRKRQALQKLKLHFLGSIPPTSPYIGASDQKKPPSQSSTSPHDLLFFESIFERKNFKKKEGTYVA